MPSLHFTNKTEEKKFPAVGSNEARTVRFS